MRPRHYNRHRHRQPPAKRHHQPACFHAPSMRTARQHAERHLACDAGGRRRPTPPPSPHPRSRCSRTPEAPRKGLPNQHGSRRRRREPLARQPSAPAPTSRNHRASLRPAAEWSSRQPSGSASGRAPVSQFSCGLLVGGIERLDRQLGEGYVQRRTKGRHRGEEVEHSAASS